MTRAELAEVLNTQLYPTTLAAMLKDIDDEPKDGARWLSEAIILAIRKSYGDVDLCQFVSDYT